MCLYQCGIIVSMSVQVHMSVSSCVCHYESVPVNISVTMNMSQCVTVSVWMSVSVFVGISRYQC